MNKKMTPHIIAAGAFVVFIVLGLACASTPSGTVLTDGTPVDYAWYGDGSAENFTISSVAQMAGFIDITRGAKGSPSKSDFNNKTVTLTADLNLSLIKNRSPIDQFMGTFDGNGKIISNLSGPQGFSLFSSGSQNLFGYIGERGIVKNIWLINVDITSDSSYDSLGSVAGINAGTIQNCYTSGNVSGISNVGGIVGRNSGTVQNCYTTVNITGKDTHTTRIEPGIKTHTEEVVFSSNIGGVVGLNSGIIRNCVALNQSITRDEYIYDEDKPPLEIAARNALNEKLRPGTTFVYPRKPQIQPSITFGRLAGSSTGTLNNNYSLQEMSVPSGNITGIHGQNINTIDTGTEDWWKDSANWSTTDGALAWDFDTIWEWNATTKLPKLR